MRGASAVLKVALFVFATVTPVNALTCVTPSDQQIIDTAVEYWLTHRQSEATSSFQENDTVVEIDLLPYRTTEELITSNPDCCRIAGLMDSEGQIYTQWQRLYFGIYTTVEISAARRIVANTGLVLGEPRRDRITINLCGEVVRELVGY